MSGEALEAELVRDEQNLDRNGLPLVNFSLSSGIYDPHAKIRYGRATFEWFPLKY